MAKCEYGPHVRGHVIKEIHYENGAVDYICDDYMFDPDDKEKEEAFYKRLNLALAPLGYVARPKSR